MWYWMRETKPQAIRIRGNTLVQAMAILLCDVGYVL